MIKKLVVITNLYKIRSIYNFCKLKKWVRRNTSISLVPSELISIFDLIDQYSRDSDFKRVIARYIIGKLFVETSIELVPTEMSSSVGI